MEKIIKDKIGYSNLVLFFIYLILGCITHIGLWINKIQAIDSNMAGSFHYTPDWETELGRWLIPFVDGLRYYICTPFLSGFLAILYISIAIVLIVNILDIKDFIFQVITGAVLIVTPCISNTLMFYYCADSYALSFIFATLYVYFIKKSSRACYFLSILSIILSLALYQAYIGTAAVLCVSVLILDILNNIDFLSIVKKGLKMVSSAMIGAVIYYVIATLILKSRNLEFAEYGGANSLTHTSLVDVKVAILTSYNKFAELLFKFLDNPYHRFYRSKYYILVIMLIAIYTIIFYCKKNKIYCSKLNITSLIILLLIIPFACGIILLVVKFHGMHILMCQGYYVIFAFISALVNKYVTETQFSKFSTAIGGIFVLTMSLYWFELFAINNATIEYNAMKRNNMIATANRILAQTECLDGYATDMSFAFVGHLSSGYPVDSYLEKMSYLETESFYAGYPEYNKVIIENIYKEALSCPINMCTDEQYEKLISTEEFKRMPIYPNNGSISIINGCVAIKLEDIVMQ